MPCFYEHTPRSGDPDIYSRITVGVWAWGGHAGNERSILENVIPRLSLRGRALPDYGNLIAVTDASFGRGSGGAGFMCFKSNPPPLSLNTAKQGFNK